MKKEPDFYSEDETAQFLDVSIPTLRTWRHRKQGPAYYKIGGKVRYKPEDLQSFVNESRVDHA